MFQTLRELTTMIGTNVVVEHNSSESGNGSVKTEGKILRVGAPGIVLESRLKTEIIPLRFIIDLYPFTPPRKVVRRKVRFIVPHQSRQHLLDRHGMPWDLIKFTTDDTASNMHLLIDHTNLGHQHRAPEDNSPDEEVELK